MSIVPRNVSIINSGCSIGVISRPNVGSVNPKISPAKTTTEILFFSPCMKSIMPEVMVIYISFGKSIDRRRETPSAVIMIAKDIMDEICKPNIVSNIFRPIKININARPFCKW